MDAVVVSDNITRPNLPGSIPASSIFEGFPHDSRKIPVESG